MGCRKDCNAVGLFKFKKNSSELRKTVIVGKGCKKIVKGKNHSRFGRHKLIVVNEANVCSP